MSKSPGNKALRKGGRSLKGQYYLVTTNTVGRRPLFNAPEAAKLLLDSLYWFDQQAYIELDTAIVMPDHIHFIAKLKLSALPDLMRKFKGYTAREINSRLGLSGSLWQSGYHDHAIRKNEDINDVRQYCLCNPIRAGIVENYEDYPHWYCCALANSAGDGAGQKIAAKSRSYKSVDGGMLERK